MKRHLGFVVAAWVLVGSTSMSRAQVRPEGQGASKAEAAASNDDKKFIQDVAKLNMGEVELARLAERRASSPAVKRFADHVISDHQRAGTELRRVASSLNVTLAQQIDDDTKDKRAELSKLSGAEFDKKFIDIMVDEHEKTIDKLEDYQKDASNAQVGSWISTTLPTLRQHLTMAEDVRSNLKGSTSKSGAQGRMRDSTETPKGESDINPRELPSSPQR